MLLNILQHPVQLPQQRFILPQMPIMLRLRDLALDIVFKVAFEDIKVGSFISYYNICCFIYHFFLYLEFFSMFNIY